MQTPISPWHSETIRVESPDGTKFAILREPSEFSMGSPTSGELKVSNGQSANSCNPSMAWSDDSRFLAVPQWLDRMQRLLILDTRSAKRAFAPDSFMVLELHSFTRGIVEGVISPKYEPQKFSFDIRKLFPDV